MGLAFTPPIDEASNSGDRGPLVYLEELGSLTPVEKAWAIENLAEFMRETEPERLIEAGWLAVPDEEAQATLDSALASILIFSVAEGVTGGRFLTGPIDSVDGVAVQTPEYTTDKEYGIEHINFGVNGIQVMWTESGWYIRPEVPQPSSNFDEVHDFWPQLHEVLEFIEPPEDSARELSLKAVAA